MISGFLAERFLGRIRTELTPFDCSSRFPSQRQYSNIKLPEKEKGMILIEFRHVPNGKAFRYQNDWWRKTVWCGGQNSMSDFCEVESEAVVGAFLKNIRPECARYIINPNKE